TCVILPSVRTTPRASAKLRKNLTYSAASNWNAYAIVCSGEFARTDESKTANQVAAPFGRREVGRGPAEGEARDRDARDTLQGFRNRQVGQARDVRSRNRIDEGVGVALDTRSRLERGTDTGYDDRFDVVFALRCCLNVLRLLWSILRAGGSCDRQSQYARHAGQSAPSDFFLHLASP